MGTKLTLEWFKYKRDAEKRAKKLHPDDKFPDRWVMRTRNDKEEWGYGVIRGK